MAAYRILLVLIAVIVFHSGAYGQERGPLLVEEIEKLLRAGVTPQRMVTLIERYGIKFEATEEMRERLKRVGADDVVMGAVEKAGLEFARKKLEEERQRVEEERRKLEEARQQEERRRAEEEAKRKAEEERLRVEEAKRREEERRKAEEEAKRKAEEERQRIEEARREEEKRRAEEEAKRKAEEEPPKVIKGKDGAEMVLIPAGEFWMGCNEGVDQQCDSDEKPGKRVYLDAFYIDKYEVTVAQYRRCVQAGGCSTDGLTSWLLDCNWEERGGRENHPINCVNWDQAKAYCGWAGKRLSTEAEWEKAARGTDGRIYPWGNQWDSSRANVGSGGTVSVGSYPSGVSPYEVHDMAGNVWEWVQDWYDGGYYRHSASRNPQGPGSGSNKVRRGGS